MQILYPWSGGCGRATSDSSTWTLIGQRERFVIQCKELIGYSMMMVSPELEDCLVLITCFILQPLRLFSINHFQ